MAEITNAETIEVCPVDSTKELLKECDNIWKKLKKCQSHLMLLGIETTLQSDTKLALLMQQRKALAAEYLEFHKRSPEIISANPDVLLKLGKEELQNVKIDLELILSAVSLKNEKLQENLKREQQWYAEEKEMINILDKVEETNHQTEQLYKTRRLEELNNKILKLRTYKEELLSALGEFIDKHYPPPQNSLNKNFYAEPNVELLALQDILENLINKSLTTPHEPYITIDESFWPPYIELLLRFGIALRHPEDPNRVRLEGFHQ